MLQCYVCYELDLWLYNIAHNLLAGINLMRLQGLS